MAKKPLRISGAALFALCALPPLGLAQQPAAMATSHTATTSAQTIDWQTSPLDLDLRGMNGERYEFLCPGGKPQPSRVAGSGPYTDDSSICTAAVHAGVLHARNGGAVTIEIRPGSNSYPGSEQNFVQSADYKHAWSGSFIVVAPDRASPSHKSADSKTSHH